MAESRRVIRVFLASPNDLTSERRIAKAEVDEFNSLWAARTACHVELVGWEDTVSRFGRPQALINEELSECELFIGIMWKRWGTPPSLSGPFTSGFHEEYSLALASREAEGKPEISLFFRDVDLETMRDPGDELKKVIAFKAEVVAQKKILFETFANADDFGVSLRRCITRYVQRLGLGENPSLRSEGQLPIVVSSQSGVEEPSDDTSTPLSTLGASFLREFITKTESDLRKSPITAIEVARFRLLGSVLHEAGNDNRTIGVHDANLLFRHRDFIQFGDSELRGLLNCGLDHLRTCTVPLWHWVSVTNTIERRALFFSTFSESTSVRVGAFSALRQIGETLAFVKSDNTLDLDNSFFIESWLSDRQSSAAKSAALEYLAICGTTEALFYIREELSRDSYETKQAAAAAILAINLRENPDYVVDELLELQTEKIEAALLAKIEKLLDLAGDEKLMSCTQHKSQFIRRISVRILRKRTALTIDQALGLSTDKDAEVRYEAFLALEALGRAFTDAQVRDLLLKSESGLGAYFLSSPDREGQSFLDRVRGQRLREMPSVDIIALAPTLVKEMPEFFELISRQFYERRNWLRDALANLFERELLTEIDNSAKLIGEAAVQDLRASAESRRKRLVRLGLDVMTSKGDVADLEVVRSVLGRDFVEYRDADVAFLRRYGGWADVDLIIRLIQRSDHGFGLLGISSEIDRRYRAAASSIFMLSTHNLPELFRHESAYNIAKHVVPVIPDARFLMIDDAVILELLGSRFDAVRTVVSTKCVGAFPKDRIARLLESYVSGSGTYYYNVVYWMDAALSLPEDKARIMAMQALGQENNY